jgi:hypothetical protein
MSTFPRRYVVLDTETDTTPVPARHPTVKLTFRLGCALVVDPDLYGDREDVYHGFTSRDEFWPVLTTTPRSHDAIFVFAHNMGFDCRIIGLWDQLSQGTFSLLPPASSSEARRYKSPLVIIESPPFIVRVFRPDGQKIVWLDTYQWLQHSLEKIGDMLGYKKGMMPDADAPDSVWMTYCQRDVDVLHAAIKRLWQFLRTHNLENFDYTPAGMSRRFYRMRFERGRIKIPEDTDLLKLDRLGYYAGRVECFRVGPVKGPIYKIDVNSLYPHVMSQHLYPCEVIAHGDSESDGGSVVRDRPDCCTAEVFCESDRSPLPVRSLDGTLHVRGRVRTVLAGPELRSALQAGCLVRIGRWVHYEIRDLFSGVVKYWSKSRGFALERRDVLLAQLIKTVMNSLHGKFGQAVGEWHVVGKDCPKGVYASGRLYADQVARWIDVRVLDGWRSERSKDGEDARSFVPIAAWTASYARVYMDWMRSVAGAEHVLYQATDSLLVTSPGYHALQSAGMLDPVKIGQFKTESIFNEVTIWNVNQYDADSAKIRSGVKRGSVEIAPGVWSSEHWESCAEGVFSRGQDSVCVATMPTVPSLRYCRGEVSDDSTTRPWWIDNWHISLEQQRLMRLPIRLEPRK